MIERLGQVLYWGFTGIGGILVLLAGALSYMRSGGDWALVATACVIAGGISWLIGRACLYVLSGR